jgi:hypothetical protein
MSYAPAFIILTPVRYQMLVPLTETATRTRSRTTFTDSSEPFGGVGPHATHSPPQAQPLHATSTKRPTKALRGQHITRGRLLCEESAGCEMVRAGLGCVRVVEGVRGVLRLSYTHSPLLARGVVCE